MHSVRHSEIDEPRFIRVARFLREKLQAGELRGNLPAERILAEQIGVGRETLRAALKELQKEGMTTRQGRMWAHVCKLRSRNSTKKLSIGIALSSNIGELPHYATLWLAELRRICHTKNMGMEVYQVRQSPSTSPRTFFRRLVTEARHDCWVLIHSTPAMQRWCLEKMLPTVVSGTVSGGILLPSVDTDYRALCRHAVSRILRSGHRNLVFLSKRQELGGDIASREEFLAAAKEREGVHAIVKHHDGTVGGICRMVDRLLALRPMPTAWLIAYAPYSLTVMTYLLHRNIRIPRDISLIFRDADPYFSNIVPEPARYVLNPRQHAKQVARLVQRVIAGQRIATEPCRIIPHMLEGKSIGKV